MPLVSSIEPGNYGICTLYGTIEDALPVFLSFVCESVRNFCAVGEYIQLELFILPLNLSAAIRPWKDQDIGILRSIDDLGQLLNAMNNRLSNFCTTALPGTSGHMPICGRAWITSKSECADGNHIDPITTSIRRTR